MTLEQAEYEMEKAYCEYDNTLQKYFNSDDPRADIECDHALALYESACKRYYHILDNE